MKIIPRYTDVNGSLDLGVADHFRRDILKKGEVKLHTEALGFDVMKSWLENAFKQKYSDIVLHEKLDGEHLVIYR